MKYGTVNFDSVIETLTSKIDKTTHDINQFERLFDSVSISADKGKDLVKALKCLIEAINKCIVSGGE